MTPIIASSLVSSFATLDSITNHHTEWEDDISAPPTLSGGPDSNKRPRSLSSATQESPRKKAILDTLLSEEGHTPPVPKASQTSATLWGHLGGTNDHDEELFNNSQAFKFNPLGGKYPSQASPSSLPAPFLLHTTSGLTLSTPPDSALRKGKTKDTSLFDPLVRPLLLLVFVNTHWLCRRPLPTRVAT